MLDRTATEYVSTPMRKLLVVVIIAVLQGAAYADPPTKPAQFQSATVCTTTAGSKIELPPGWWIVPPERWSELDLELRRLQEAETRLKAENATLTASIENARPAWYWISGALVAGFTGALVWKAVRN